MWSLEIFLIVCHAFRLLPVRSVDVIIPSHLLLFSAAILLISTLPVSRVVLSKGLLRYCFLNASYMLFNSSDRNVVASTPPRYMFTRCHTYCFDKPLVVLWIRVNFINNDINVCYVSTLVSLPQVKSSSECSGPCHKHMVYSDTEGAMLSMGIGVRTDFTHMLSMLEDAKMRSGLYSFFHLALLKDFGSFASCMSVRLFDSAHCTTAALLLYNPRTHPLTTPPVIRRIVAHLTIS